MRSELIEALLAILLAYVGIMKLYIIVQNLGG